MIKTNYLNTNMDIKRIRAMLKKGDINTIARRTGISRVTVGTTFNKTSLSDLTKKEKEVLIAALLMLNERMAENIEIENQIKKLQ